MLPAAGASSPAISLRSVDLPAPVVAHDGGFGARGDGQVYSFEQKLLIAVAVRNTAKDNTHMKTINSGPAEKGPVKPQTGLLYGTASV